MKRLWFCALMPILLFSGCASGTRGRELENTVLAQVMGVDNMDGGFLLTIAGTDGKEETVFQQAWGSSLEDACEAIHWAGERWVSLTNVTQFILGDGVEPGQVLHFILDESGMSWRGSVWYAPVAAAMIEDQPDGGMARLKLWEDSDLQTISVLHGLANWVQYGTLTLPALSNQTGVLSVSGNIVYEHGM